MSSEERSTLDQEIEEVYRDFVRIVAKGRKLTDEEVHQRGEGRVFSGRAALERKLVDQLGGFEDAVTRLCELTQVSGEPELALVEFNQRSWNPLQALRPLAGEVVWAMLPLGIPVP